MYILDLVLPNIPILSRQPEIRLDTVAWESQMAVQKGYFTSILYPRNI